MKQSFQATVLSHESLSADYRLLRLSVPEIAAVAKPGQFVHLRVPQLDPASLRRPFSICDAANGELTILYKVVGRGTAAMLLVNEGDRLDILGPLGNAFPVSLATQDTVPLFVGGGFGVAPLYFLARTLGRGGLLFAGGRTARDILLADWFPPIGVDFRVATNDGSLGCNGLVTDALDVWRSQNPETPVELFACGPAPMLRAIDMRASEWGVKAHISFDRRMACGIGACLGCTQRVRTSSGIKTVRVCVEGPVFERDAIVWEEV